MGERVYHEDTPATPTLDGPADERHQQSLLAPFRCIRAERHRLGDAEAAQPLPLVRLRRRRAGLAGRLHGPAAVQPRPRLRRHRADRQDATPRSSSRTPPSARRPTADQVVGQLLHVDLPDRLGDRRHLLRHPRRPLGPRQDHARDDPALLVLHRAQRPVRRRVGLRLLPLPDRPGRRRRVRRRRRPAGRDDARQGPAVHARPAAVVLRHSATSRRRCCSCSWATLESSGFFKEFTVFGCPVTPWRFLFLIGTVPGADRPARPPPARGARSVEEAGGRRQAPRRPARTPRCSAQSPWRGRRLAGLALAFSGVVGLWAITFFSVDLQQYVFKERMVRAALRRSPPSEHAEQAGARRLPQPADRRTAER